MDESVSPLAGESTISKRTSLKDIFGPSGRLAEQLPQFEYRPSQLRMAEAVLEAIENRHHLCVEAGTGTGKTLAYLIPALFSKKRVVISTATKNLQDQLFSKDIPFIRKHLFPKLSVTYMKGRNNYLCLKRLYEQKEQLLPFQGADEEWQALAAWAERTETGDRAELDWVGDRDPFWNWIDARSETCLGQKCDLFDRCFVTRMRQRAFESDLVVVNHALFFANLALERDEIGKLLPDFGVLIMDEAHEIEDIAASHFGRRLSNYQIEEFCRDCLNHLPPRLSSTVGRVREAASWLFKQLPEQEGRFSLNFFRVPGGGLQDFRERLLGPYQKLKSVLSLLFSEMQLLEERPVEWEPLVRRLEQLSLNLDGVFEMDNPDHVYWYERRRRGIFLHVTPIDVAGLLKEELFARTEAAVLTSATLTTEGNFDYLRGRLGVDGAEELSVPGEFDYAAQSILLVPARFPSPKSPDYFLRALRLIRQILDLTEGHAFLLFTSFQQMDRFHQALQRDIEFPLFKQGERPKNRLLDLFRETPNAVLCATASFWQGVDVRGQALRAVVIDKLPFQVPTEPVVAARLNRLQRDGDNAFVKYTVPNAIITLKQGLGRLIRSRQDRGLLAILDSRLRTRRYGELFLRSLPNCPVTDNMDEVRNFFQKVASPGLGRT